MPSIGQVLKKLGMLEKVKEAAYLNNDGIVWRDADGKLRGRLRLPKDGSEYIFQLGQKKMNALVLEELRNCPSVEVKFGLRCVGIEDLPSAKSVKVMAHQKGLPDGDVLFEGGYVIGTDGCNSNVRRIMCIPFEGYTFSNFKMITTDLVFDFAGKFGYDSMNFFIDPTQWGVIAYTGEEHDNGPEWRVAFVEPTDLPTDNESVKARATERIKNWTRGSSDFSIVRAETYWLHQRCASQARKGRVMLAGDALHVLSAHIDQKQDRTH